MKKLLALCLVFALLLPTCAFAAVLSDGWDSASLEDLLAAQQEISNRISELRAAAVSDVERVELSGTGTSILSAVAVPFSPSRVIIECEGDTSVKFTGGNYDHAFEAKTREEAFFEYTGTFDLLIESPGAWSVVVEPITAGGVLPMSGNGPFVSNFFELPAPMIVNIAADPSEMEAILSSFFVDFVHQYDSIESWDEESLVMELFSASDEPFSVDVVLQPVKGRDQYCIAVSCEPGVEWTISPK